MPGLPLGHQRVTEENVHTSFPHPSRFDTFERADASVASVLSIRSDDRARLETDSEKRKEMPIYSGVMRYFPDALAEIARLSKAGNDKHNPDEPLHWARSKSGDELDCLVRHLLEAGTLDTDGFLHDVKI